MVMSVYMLAVECGERPVEDRDCMMLQGDEEAAVHWVRRCRGGKEIRSVRQPWSRTHPPSRCANVCTHLPRLFPVLEAVSRECGAADFLLAGAGVDSHVSLLLAYIVYAWGTNGLMAGTIAGHLTAVKFLYHQERGLELFLRHPWVVDALKGVTHSHAKAGTKSRTRRPVAWSVCFAGESQSHQWGPGGPVLWLAPGASFFFLAQAGEMLASKEGRYDDGHLLCRGDVDFYRGSTQRDWTIWGQADRVEVWFRSLKGDQLRDGMVTTRARAGSPLPCRDRDGAVDLMIKLLSSCRFLP